MGTVSTLLVRPAVAALGARPAALAAFYGATDLTPQLLGDADARISAAQFCVAWSELIRLSGDPQIALALAAATPPGAFGVVEYVCRAAPTLGEALRRWVRYLNLLDDAVEVALVEVAGGDGDVALRVTRESEAPAPASHELCFALVVAQARQICTRPFRPVAVRFTHRLAGDAAAYRAFFDAPVAFGADHTELVLPAAAVAAALTTADPSLLAILTRHAEHLRASAPDDPPLVAQVKRALREALRGDDAQIETIARGLGLTARSLQRRLKDEGGSFVALREEVRRTLATRYLDDGLAIAEISFLLGFSEPSAFFRAFKRWTGTTPIESRAARRAALAT
jgi:AraC-like DNA-binding protein